MTIETVMVFALGFLVAALMALALMGAVWKRAVRLTTRRVENAVPLSMAEIKADKDQLRAEHAVGARRLEIRADALAERVNLQAIEIARDGETMRDQRAEIATKAERIATLEASEAGLEQTLAATRAELEERQRDLRVSEEILRQKDQEFAALDRDLAAKMIENDSQRVEIVALTTQVDNLRSDNGRLTRDLEEARNDLVGHRLSFAETSTLLSDERRRAAGLSGDIERLQAELAAATETGIGLRGEIDALTTRLAEAAEARSREQAARDLAEQAAAHREAERDQTQAELAALRQQSTDTIHALRAEAETERAEKGLAEGQLAHARAEREAVQREVASLKRAAANANARDAKEQQKLRQRIDDVAVEISRVAMVLEGPGTRIDAILADFAARNAADGKVRRARDLSLAERIQALKEEAERRQALEASGHAAE